MWNVNDSASSLFQHLNDIKQMLYFLLCKGRSRLIKYDDFCIHRYCFCNLYHLSLWYRHRTHDPFRIYINFQFFKYFFCVVIDFFLIYHDAAHFRVTSEPEIIHDVSFERLVQFLVNHCNSIFKSFFRILEINLFSLQLNLATVFVINSEKAFHQCWLSGSIFTHQCMDSACFNCQGHMI